MRSEAKKTFQHGFNLTEQELRRIFDSLTQQMERARQDTPPKASFEVKFKNGVIANPTTLEEIFALENIGSGAIVRLLMKLENCVEPISSIKLEFIDVNNDPEPGYTAVSYTVVGEDRDWVFVTSSQIEERISRIKTSAILNKLAGRGRRESGFLLLFMLMIVIAMFSLFSYYAQMIRNLPTSTETRFQTVESLEARWKSGEITDPVEIILELERAQIESMKQLDNRLESPGPNGVQMAKAVAGPIVTLILVAVAIYSCTYFFPPYNFIWGDYIKVYEKRKATGRFILGVIILGIVLSILGNYFSDLLGIGR